MKTRSTSNRKGGLPSQWPFAVLMLWAGLFLLSCTEQPPVKIGFVGGLTGRVADLGVAARDAVTLAIEEQNQAGGVAGRKLELVVLDDRQNAENLEQAINQLADAQVAAIVGPLTSSMAVVAQPLIKKRGIVTISPTVTTDRLSGQDDFFLRVITPLSKSSRLMAKYVTGALNLQRFAVAYDKSNLEYTGTWLKYFQEAFEDNGGQLVAVEAFTSQPGAYFLPIARRLLQAEPDGVLLLSSAIDTALLSQQIRKLESPVPLFSAEWASTSDLMSFGGRSVNGMRSFQSINANCQEPRYLAFKDKFTRRFGYPPSFASVLSFDAASILFAGLAKNSDPDSLKNSLLELGPFPGLQSDMTFDRYGDVERSLFLTVVENGAFMVVKQ